MAKINVLEYDTVAANNTDINSISIQGTAPVSNFDNAFRELMAEIAAAVPRVVDKAAGSYTAAKTDHNQLWRATGAATFNLTAAATLTTGWALRVKADGGAITIDPSGAELINGAATLTVADGSAAFIVCTGTAFFALTLGDVNTSGAQTISGAKTFSAVITANAGISGTTGTFSGAVSGTTGTFSSTVGGTVVSASTAFRAAAGSAVTPSISLTGDTDTGIYSYAANELGFAVNGAFLANMTATGFNFGRALSDPTLAGITMQANGQLVVGMDANNAIFNRFTSDGTMIQFRRTNSTVGTIAVTTTATAYNTSSDKRLKSELREFDSGAIIDGLAFGEFSWLKDGSIGYGVLAQDAKEVFAQAVSVDDEGWHSVDYSKFVPVLAAELKTLRKRVAELEAAR